MLALCPACHAKIHRTRAALPAMPPLLLELWREQHPTGHEQTALNFNLIRTAAIPVSLFDRKEIKVGSEEILASVRQDSSGYITS